MKKIVIIGGGFGGFNCALGLEKEKNLEIILIDPSDYFTYTPLIHEVAVGQIPENVVKIYFKKFLKRTIHHKSKVVNIFFKDKKVELDDNLQLSYDYLIIACGSYPNKFIEGTENLQTLKTLEDAVKIKELLNDAKGSYIWYSRTLPGSLQLLLLRLLQVRCYQSCYHLQRWFQAWELDEYFHS